MSYTAGLAAAAGFSPGPGTPRAAVPGPFFTRSGAERVPIGIEPAGGKPAGDPYRRVR